MIFFKLYLSPPNTIL